MNNNYHFIDLCRLSRKVPDALALIGGSLCKGNADDKLSLDFHYCPLVKGCRKWAVQTRKSQFSATLQCAATTA